MRLLRATLLCAGLAMAAPPAFGQAVPARSELPAHLRPTRQTVPQNLTPPSARVPQAAVPAQLSAAERESYRAVFADLRAENWSGAGARLDAMRSGPLHDLARSMLYTAPG